MVDPVQEPLSWYRDNHRPAPAGGLDEPQAMF
jgi:hypothetical protein